MIYTRIAIMTGLLSAILAFQQATVGGSAPNSMQVQPQTGQKLRVDVDLVLVTVTVTDPANRYVNGLRLEDFQLWEDKTEQQVEYFSTENIPASVGVIFDTSGSMQNKVAQARAAANVFLNMGDRDDEYFLIQFSDSARIAQDFTGDITKLQSRLLFTEAKGSTSLYDALYLGLEKVNRGSNGRKALLLITDGEDNHSRYSLSDVRNFAREHDALIYSIGIMDENSVQFSGFSGRSTLLNLAELTGGLAFFPRYLEALPTICAQIGLDLKNQYVLGYRSSNFSEDGKWRKIHVKIKKRDGLPRLSVRSKSGYYPSAFARLVK